MIPGMLLSLREGLEAALIIGIVLGALKKANREELGKIVWMGTFSAIVVSLLVGLGLYLLDVAFEGTAEEIFEGITMLLAAGVLTWMIFWMRAQSRTITAKIETDVKLAAMGSNKSALFFIAFLAVMREGIELALFLTAASVEAGGQETLIGAVLGLVVVIVLAWLMFTSLVKLDLKKFFNVTGGLLLLFAAGLVAHGVHELNEVGWIPSVIEHVWDINPILNEKSFTGEILKTLFGYNGNPSLTEVIAYVAYFGVILFALRRDEPKSQLVTAT